MKHSKKLCVVLSVATYLSGKGCLLGCVLVGSTLIGCAEKTGNSTLAAVKAEDLQSWLVEGRTRKEEVRQKLGQPSDVDFDRGYEKWTYVHLRKSAKAINFMPVANMFVSGTDDTTKKLVVVFGNDGVVMKTALTESQGETKGGLLQ